MKDAQPLFLQKLPSPAVSLWNSPGLCVGASQVGASLCCLCIGLLGSIFIRDQTIIQWLDSEVNDILYSLEILFSYFLKMNYSMF